MIRAYHFVGDTLRDGRPVPPDGEWLIHNGPAVICESGLHASRHPFDAMQYAPGNVLCLVDCDDIVDEHEDKLLSRRRRIVARFDASRLLREFAADCAESVLHLVPAELQLACIWAIDVARRYARGECDEDERAAAYDAADAAKCDAAYEAAYAAARDAADAAKCAAAYEAAYAAAYAAADAAARDAADAAACAAARDAARAAAHDAARAAAHDAARAAAHDAAHDAARDAARDAAHDAAYGAAYNAARDEQRRRFSALVNAQFTEMGIAR